MENCHITERKRIFVAQPKHGTWFTLATCLGCTAAPERPKRDPTRRGTPIPLPDSNFWENPLSTPYGVVIVGAGILGLATARELLRRSPDIRLAIVDKEEAPGCHQSGHNSGVLHAGVYYKPGSLKAELCVQGKAAIELFAA